MKCKTCGKKSKVLDDNGECFNCGFLYPVLKEEFKDKLGSTKNTSK